MARRTLSFAGTVLATFAVSACVLVASGTSNLQTVACGFQGQGTPCGACVLTSCLALLNSCCTDGACSSNLPYLDGCASGSAPLDCTLLVNGGDFGASAAFVAFGSCIASHCASCTGTPIDAGMPDVLVKDATPPRDTTVGPGYSCSSTGSTCFCEYTTNPFPSTESCTPDAYPDGICCADRNYGTVAGTSCTCSPFSCTLDQFGCECSSNYDPTSSQSPDMCAGTGCCVSGDGLCSCGDDADCGDGGGTGQPVYECLPVNTGCDGDQVQLTSCSPD